MGNPIANARARAFDRQNGFCFYCGHPTWLSDADAFARRYALSPKQVRHLRCTAEHLVARQDGGGNGDNIVAACLACNRRRHLHRSDRAPTPERYRARVRYLMAKGRWLPFAVVGTSEGFNRPARSHR